MNTKQKSAIALAIVACLGHSLPAHAGGGSIKGDVTIKSTIKNGAGAIAGRDAIVHSVVVNGGSIKGNVVIDSSIKNGVGAIAGRDAIVSSVVVNK